MNRILLIFALVVLTANHIMAQSNGESKSITLVVAGEGLSKDEAIKNALRAALEQTYGTFVSSNTEIVNDEMTRDEIVSVSSGIIEKYTELSSDITGDGMCSVTLQATLSIDNLVKFAQSKGASIELAGAAFVMNMKMRKLNAENERQALAHLFKKMLNMCKATSLFDYTIETKEPRLTNQANVYEVPAQIKFTANANYNELYNIFNKTINALSLTESEIQKYKESNTEYYQIPILSKNGHAYSYVNQDGRTLYLRNNIEDIKNSQGMPYLKLLSEAIGKSFASFVISDNLGDKTTTISVNNEHAIEQASLECLNFYPLAISIDCHNAYGLINKELASQSPFLKIPNIKIGNEQPYMYFYSEGVEFFDNPFIAQDAETSPLTSCASITYPYLNLFIPLQAYHQNKNVYVIPINLIYSENDLSMLTQISITSNSRMEIMQFYVWESDLHDRNILYIKQGDEYYDITKDVWSTLKQ
jgi:hypothetical protein